MSQNEQVVEREVDLVEELFKKILDQDSVNDLLHKGKRKFMSPRVLEFSGILEGELDTPRMVYRPIDESDVYIPDWVQERINWVQANYEVEQVIVGDEKEEPMSAEAEAAEKTILIGKVVLAVVAVVAIAVALGTILLAVAGAVLGLVALGGAVAGLAMIDPCVCIVMSTNSDPKQRWICIAEWVHES